MEVTAAIHYQHSTKQLEYAALATDVVDIGKRENRLRTGSMLFYKKTTFFMNSANKTYPWEAF